MREALVLSTREQQRQFRTSVSLPRMNYPGVQVIRYDRSLLKSVPIKGLAREARERVARSRTRR